MVSSRSLDEAGTGKQRENKRILLIRDHYAKEEPSVIIVTMSDDTVFPMIFGLAGKTFLWVYKNKAEWVDFTLNEMKEPTQLFKIWKSYCVKKSKENNGPRTKPAVKQICS